MEQHPIYLVLLLVASASVAQILDCGPLLPAVQLFNNLCSQNRTLGNQQCNTHCMCAHGTKGGICAPWSGGTFTNISYYCVCTNETQSDITPPNPCECEGHRGLGSGLCDAPSINLCHRDCMCVHANKGGVCDKSNSTELFQMTYAAYKCTCTNSTIVSMDEASTTASTPTTTMTTSSTSTTSIPPPGSGCHAWVPKPLCPQNNGGSE